MCIDFSYEGLTDASQLTLLVLTQSNSHLFQRQRRSWLCQMERQDSTHKPVKTMLYGRLKGFFKVIDYMWLPLNVLTLEPNPKNCATLHCHRFSPCGPQLLQTRATTQCHKATLVPLILTGDLHDQTTGPNYPNEPPWSCHPHLRVLPSPLPFV